MKSESSKNLVQLVFSLAAGVLYLGDPHPEAVRVVY